MVRIVLDARSHQAIRHAGTEVEAYGLPPEKAGRWRGRRLNGLFATVEALGHTLDLGLPTAASLQGAGALVIASRSQVAMFTQVEIDAVVDFVAKGGGLLLMANHRLFVAPQQQLVTALKLPLRLEDMSITGSPEIRLRAHPLIDGCSQLGVRNSSFIVPNLSADVLATFVDERLAFAVACDRETGRRGRVVVTADSGFMASADDKERPMFETGDNARFIDNVIRWLVAPV